MGEHNPIPNCIFSFMNFSIFRGKEILSKNVNKFRAFIGYYLAMFSIHPSMWDFSSSIFLQSVRWSYVVYNPHIAMTIKIEYTF